MKDYIKLLPGHIEKYIGENDLFLEIFEGALGERNTRKPPLLFVHGAYTGSWMWSKYIPHFIERGYTCYVMNMRSHYKSRGMDMTKITFEDYLTDIREVLGECSEPPIVIGFSMGGILCQKLAEEEGSRLKGLVLVDTSISREVNRIAPYRMLEENLLGAELEFETNENRNEAKSGILPGLVIPAPIREHRTSPDESVEDIDFQKKYLSMEAARAISAISCWMKGVEGVSIDSSQITCPCLVLKAINQEGDEEQGKTTAMHLNADYTGFIGMSHTGLLVGQRYLEVVERILQWFEHTFPIEN